MKKEIELSIADSDSEGGITSEHQMNDGVNVKFPYSFFGSIYDEDEERALLAVLKQESETMGPQVVLFQKEFAKRFDVNHAFAASNCTTAMHAVTQAFGIKEGDEVIVTLLLLLQPHWLSSKKGENLFSQTLTRKLSTLIQV